jgi:hypothetical protein
VARAGGPHAFLHATASFIKNGDTIGGKALAFPLAPAINHSGTVVFKSDFSDGGGIFTPSNLLVKTGDTVDGLTLTGIAVPAINNRGTVAFLGHFAGGDGVFTLSDVVVKTGDIIEGKILATPGGPQ